MIREFHLSPRGKGGVSCDDDGAFIGAIPILKRLEKNGKNAWRPRDCEELSEQLGKYYGLPIDMSAKTGGLKAVANALNDDDIVRAQIATVLLGIPDPPPLSKCAGSREQMIKLIRDLHWSGLLKWDADEHPRWPAGSADGRGGEFAPKGEGGGTATSPTSQSDTDDRTDSYKPEPNSIERNPHIQLADAGMSDASDDPVVEAVRAAAAAQKNPGARSQGESVGSEREDFWPALGSRLSHEAKSALSQIGRAQIEESEANVAATTAGMNAIAHVLRSYADYRAQPWLDDDGRPVEIPAATSQAELMIRLQAHEPLTRPATNADWIDPLINLSSFGAMAAGPTVRLIGPGAEALDAAIVSAGESGSLIGNSGYRSVEAFTDAVTEKYQRLYDEHYADTMDLVSRGFVENNPLVIGGRTDTLARVDLRDWLKNGEAIGEGPGQIIQINRRLYDPLGTGRFRIPDVYVPESRTILDGSLQFKTSSTSQISDFRAFSGGANIIMIRPSSALSSRVSGSYGIVH